MKDYYKILEISEEASAEVIHMAYKALVRKYHPDEVEKGSASEEKIKEVNEAYKILSDPVKRRQYDALCRNMNMNDTNKDNSSEKEMSSDELNQKKDSIKNVTKQSSGKKWYYSYPVLIITFILFYPVSLILSVLRFLDRKNQSGGYKIRSGLALGFNTIGIILLISLVLWMSGQENKWQKEYRQCIEQSNYTEAKQILNQKAESGISEKLVDCYIELWEITNDYSDAGAVVEKYYESLNDPEKFSAGLEEKIEKIADQMPEKEKMIVEGVLNTVSEAKAMREKESEEQSLADERKKAEEVQRLAEEEQKRVEKQQRREEEQKKIEESSVTETSTTETSVVETQEQTEVAQGPKEDISETVVAETKIPDNIMDSFTLQSMVDSVEQYSMYENPYFLDGLDGYIDLINQSYENVKSKQTVEVVTMEAALTEAGISKKMIKKILELDGTDFCQNSEFIRVDSKNESNILDSLIGDVDKKGYYEVSSKEKTAKDTGTYYYVGKIKNNRPEGEGALFIYSDNGINLLYAGEFKNGKYEGKGIGFRNNGFGYDILVIGKYVKNEKEGKGVLYNDGDIDGVYSTYISIFDEYSDGKLNEYSKDKQQEIMERVLKKNSACRLGVMLEIYPHTNTKVAINVPVVKSVVIYSGKFKNNLYEKGKLYDSHGVLKYEGSFKNGKYHGNGTLYYDSGENIRYAGEFKNGKYHGNGVLYNEDGSIRKKGKFSHEEIDTELENIMSELFTSSITTALYSTWAEKGAAYFFEIPSDQEKSEIAIEKSEDEYYIFPDSDVRYYSEEELKTCSKEELRLGRNEIYARHGRIFESEDLKVYFQQQSWYYGYLTADQFDDSLLNEYEKKNLELIKTVENQ